MPTVRATSSRVFPAVDTVSTAGESPLLESGYLPFLRSLQFRHDDPRRHIPDLALEIVDACTSPLIVIVTGALNVWPPFPLNK